MFTVPARRSHPWFALAALLAAVLVGVALRPAVPSTEARLSGRYRLADLIAVEQQRTASLRAAVDQLRRELDRERAAIATNAALAPSDDAFSDARLAAGLAAVRGPGVRVVLDDSSLDEPPPGATVNDLVIHSQDVQAAVNALWRAGAEAVAINGERLVSTSAVLCVGNTLLLNGTVHSPPYEIVAVGAGRDRFEADRLYRRLRQQAAAFSLGLDVERLPTAEVPAYEGSLKPRYARPL